MAEKRQSYTEEELNEMIACSMIMLANFPKQCK